MCHNSTVVAFGVSLPDNRKETGRGNVWLPLKALRCGTTSITAIGTDETCGLLAIGDEAGYFVLYEVYDEERSIGSTDIIRWIYDKFVVQAEDMITMDSNVHDNESDSSNKTGKIRTIDDFSDVSYYQELTSSYNDSYQFSTVRQVCRLRFNDTITCIYILGNQSTIVIGTSDGSLYYCNHHNILKAGIAPSLPGNYTTSTSSSTSSSSLNSWKKVENIMTTGACGSVKGIDYGYYHNKPSTSLVSDQLTFAYYIFYESGHVLVIDAITFTILSYSLVMTKVKPSTGGGSGGSSSHAVVTLHDVSTMQLLGNTNKIVKRPSLLSYLYVQARIKQLQEQMAINAALASANAVLAAAEAVAAEAAANSVANTPPPEPVKRSFFGRSTAPPPPPATSPKPTTSNSSTVSTSSNVNSNDNTTMIKGFRQRIIDYSENDIPRKLCFIKGIDIVTMLIDKFYSPSKKIDSFGNLANGVTGVSIKTISNHSKKRVSIITSCVFTFSEEDSNSSKRNPIGSITDGFDSFELQDGENYLACLDEAGILRVISLKSKSTVSEVNLLEGIVEKDEDSTNEDDSTSILYAGTILPNGNCYMLQKGTMLYSATVTTTIGEQQQQRLVYGLPERAYPQSRGIDRSHVLLHGREQFLAGLKMTIKKRRSSVINLTAAPTDLYKIFAKTREQRSKDELLAGSQENTVSDNSAVRANTKAAKAANDMQELQRNFAERGDRINRIAMKMDDFKLSAQEYKQTAAAQKELLRQRNARWGLF